MQLCFPDPTNKTSFSSLKIAKMADNRMPNMAGPPGVQHPAGFNMMPNMRMNMGPMGQPMYPGGVQQQFAPGMQFYPTQGMNPSMMGPMPGMAPAMYAMQPMHPPGGPPPPYTQQLAASYHSKGRGSSSGAKSNVGSAPKPKTDKERYFEEQQKRLRQFHRPGAPVADANTLIENLFGKTEKSGQGQGRGHGPGGVGGHQSVGHGGAGSRTVQGHDDDDDGFGDFLGGPTTTAAPAPTSAATTNNIPETTHHPPNPASPAPEIPVGDSKPDEHVDMFDHKPAVEKKDLMSMMMECSDLNAPQKAKGFHKPSLMEVQKSGVHHGAKNTSIHHESDHARRWDNTQDLEGLFIVEKKAKAAPPPTSVLPQSPTTSSFPPTHHHDGSSFSPPDPQSIVPTAQHGAPRSAEVVTGLPEWCHDSGQNLPVVYQHVLEAVSDEETIVTERLYPILLMSGLPRELLGGLWSLANTQTPGQLTRSELWILLAFVALVQNKYEVTSPAILKRCPQAPVPFLGQSSAQAAGAAHSTHVQPPTPVSAGHDSHVEGVGIHNAAMLTSHAEMPSSPFTANFPPPSSVSGVAVASPQVAILPTSSNDDDFADFQTAPTPAVRPPQLPMPTAVKTPITRTEDSYGEFIGGTSSSTSEQSLSSVPKEAADKLERMYGHDGMTGMTADEQYNSNVRNFFCSSDSSTAKGNPTQKMTRHTTPNSMDDEDFTDAHDSMSQVSTSEQSENEDIRAFENYVEEFNRKKEAQASSENPLQSSGPRSPGGTKGSQKAGKGIGSKEFSSSATVKTPPAVNFPIPRPPGPVSGLSALPALNQKSSIPTTKQDGEEDDFADFKSASDLAGSKPASSDVSVKKVESSGDMVLMGEEDKYSALRSLTTTAPSLFESKNEGDAVTGAKSEAETDDWADFASAVDPSSGPAPSAVAELSVSQVHSVSSSSPPSGFSAVGTEAGTGDDWADFSAATSVASTARPDLSSATLSSDAGLFSMAPAQSSAWTGVSTVIPKGQETSDRENVTSSAVQLAGIEITSTGNVSQREEAADDWADFASAAPSSGTGTSKAVDWEPAAGKSDSHISTGNSFSVVGRGETSTGPFSAAQMTTSSEVFTGPDQSAVLTVKKQNLGTSEIMSVFKVRDDPVTMSSYELPKQPTEQAKVGHRQRQESYRRRRSRSGSKEPDMDDDFGMGPPPLDSVGDEEDDQEFSRGYDLDDIVNAPVPTTMYSPFGFGHHGSGYARSAFTAVTKTSTASRERPTPSTESRSHSMSPDSGETDSLSNRVSSLREDSQSISSLDLPASKISSMEAQRDSDNGGTDSQSVSSMEFGVGEGGLRVDAGVAESKSLDSLDLKSGGAGEEEEEEEENGRWARQGSQPPSSVMGPAPILADRYNLDGQAEGSERYAYEWERCLASSCRHINGANNVFNTISSSTICNEVLKSPQGTDYVLGLIEIYRVVRRIMATLSTTAVTSACIEQNLKQIDLAWNNLTAFLVGASLLPDETTLAFSHAVLKSDSPTAQSKACGVCLLDVDCLQRSVNGSEETAKLSYGGRQYHAACANFWVNCVDSMLPALKLPELL